MNTSILNIECCMSFECVARRRRGISELVFHLSLYIYKFMVKLQQNSTCKRLLTQIRVSNLGRIDHNSMNLPWSARSISVGRSFELDMRWYRHLLGVTRDAECPRIILLPVNLYHYASRIFCRFCSWNTDKPCSYGDLHILKPTSVSVLYMHGTCTEAVISRTWRDVPEFRIRLAKVPSAAAVSNSACFAIFRKTSSSVVSPSWISAMPNSFSLSWSSVKKFWRLENNYTS